MNMDDIDVLYKIILLGDAGVGKTNLLAYFASPSPPAVDDNGVAESFHEVRKPTIGVEFGSKTILHPDGTRIRVQVWDTAGQERYRAITSAHYRRASGAILVYDVTNPKSFDNALNSWLSDLRGVADEDMGILSCITLVGNKIDKLQNMKDKELLKNGSTGEAKSDTENENKKAINGHTNSNGSKSSAPTYVTKEQHEKACQEHRLFSQRTSAKTGENVVKAFEELIINVHNHFKTIDDEEDFPNAVVITGDNNSNKPSDQCC
mmetsp:Transcript_16075/g.18199  ORF Transcript_16075/g.18199 Transcript_16075/m.18199 type:complete len:263 (-) Transcript_16075:637-1425(-)